MFSVFLQRQSKLFKKLFISSFYLSFLSGILMIHRKARKGEGISVIFLYHLYSFHRHLDVIHVSRAFAADSASLHITTSFTRTGNLCFPSASRELLSYAPLKATYTVFWTNSWRRAKYYTSSKVSDKSVNDLVIS